MKTYLISQGDYNSVSVKKLFAEDAENDVLGILTRTERFNAEEEEFEELTEKTLPSLKGSYRQGYIITDVQDGDDLYAEFLRGSDHSFNLDHVILDGECYIPIITWEGGWNREGFEQAWINVELIQAETFQEATRAYLHDRYDPDDQASVETVKIANGCYENRIDIEGAMEDTIVYLFHARLRKIVSRGRSVYEMEWQETR